MPLVLCTTVSVDAAVTGIYCQFNAVTFIVTVLVLGLLLIICVILLILQHFRFRRLKRQTEARQIYSGATQQTGQLYSQLLFPCETLTLETGEGTRITCGSRLKYFNCCTKFARFDVFL